MVHGANMRPGTSSETLKILVATNILELETKNRNNYN